MSFGFSVSDVFALSQLVHRTYTGWRDACGQYAFFTNDLESLDAILARVENEARSSSSIFKRDPEDLKGWNKVSKGCSTIVSDLEGILIRYDRLSKGRNMNSRRRNWDYIQQNWDKLRFSSHNFEDLHRRLVKTTTAIGAYVSVLGITSQSRVENGVLPEILRKIDDIAAQLRRGNSTICSSMTTYSNDNKEVWREFRKDLISSGFRSSAIHQYSSALKTYLYRLQRNGMLDEDEPDVQLQSISEEQLPTTLNTEEPAKPNLQSNNSVPHSPYRLRSTDGSSRLSERHASVRDDGEYALTISEGGPEGCEAPIYVQISEEDDISGPLVLYDGGVVLAEDEKRTVTTATHDQCTPSPVQRSEKQETTQDSILEVVPDTTIAACTKGGYDMHKGSSPESLLKRASPNRTDTAELSRQNQNFATATERGSSCHSRKQDNEVQHTDVDLPSNPIVLPAGHTKSATALIEWKSVPSSELLPSITHEMPTLPEGWDCRTDPQNRVFYVDSYARGIENRCFWNPPVRGALISPELWPKGWKLCTNIFGRLYWQHKCGIISYGYPALAEYRFDSLLHVFNETRRCTNANHGIRSTDAVPTIHPDVWDNGIWDTTLLRGKIWWESSDVNERTLMFELDAALDDLEFARRLDSYSPVVFVAWTGRIEGNTQDPTIEGVDPRDLTYVHDRLGRGCWKFNDATPST
ncbi:MAG: hypothetical protein M1820_005052 [Bogoriella megaspora]|nr:MAG: hypothetical protein M1820_005052 [Bogoriella megaspora]